MNPARLEGGPPEFLVIGHAVQDLLSEDARPSWRLGGAAVYASVLARNLGLRTAILTAVGPGLDLAEALPGIEIVSVPSAASTRFRNVYGEEGRRQFIPSRADRITVEHLPDGWRKTPVVLLGPVVGEVDPALAACFSSAILGAGAQGWLREVAQDTSVRAVLPEDWKAAPVLEHASALFLSDEDVPAHAAPAALKLWSGMVETVAFTRGYNGADVCFRGEWRHINAFPARAVDPTGAGDIFAAGFLVRFHETGDVWDAARFGACAASFVVEGEGVTAVPERDQIERRLERYPDIIAT